MLLRTWPLLLGALVLASCDEEREPVQPAEAASETAQAPARSDGLLGVGAPAPELGLPDQSGTLRRLGDFRGKQIVLYFYPRDATPGCTVEARGFRDAYSEIEEAGAVVLGVSTDDVSSHAEFAGDEELPFPLLADRDERIARAYGVGLTLGMASRVTFVIDERGVVKQVFPDVDPSQHVDEVLRVLRN